MTVTSDPTAAATAFRAGNHRIRTAEQTWDVIRSRLGRFGITRIADVTGLDVIGIPVVMAIRPLAKTLAVSQGKGSTTAQARVSAAMESIEMWHAEYATPPVTHRQRAARDLDLPYDLFSLGVRPGALLTTASPLDWVDAVGMTTGSVVPVPAGLIGFEAAEDQTWQPPGLTNGSNGLASGNCREEAVLQALYEVIERDAVSAPDMIGRRIGIPPGTVTDPRCAELVEKVVRADATLRIFQVPNRFAVPCFGAEMWSDDFPVVALGWGAHLDPGIALARALTEAAQSRLATIAGSRDDLPAVYEKIPYGAGTPPPGPDRDLPWAEVTAGTEYAAGSITEELALVRDALAPVLPTEPLMVDLSTDEDLAVVRVLVPATAIDVARMHPGTTA